MLTYSRGLAGLSAISTLWWVVDILFPALTRKLGAVIPGDLAAMLLSLLAMSLWVMRRPDRPLASASVWVGLVVNVLGFFRSIGRTAWM